MFIVILLLLLLLLLKLVLSVISFTHRSRLKFYDSVQNVENLLLSLSPSSSYNLNPFSVSLKTNYIPQIIHQTYSDIKKVPLKVYENIKKFAPLHQHVLYDDAAALKFLTRNFNSQVSKAFESLVLGAHKADLFRYAVLYICGGIYLDIKTELIEDVSKTFPSDTTNITTVLSQKYKEIYQGVIAAPPRQSIFLYLIDAIVKSGPTPFYNRFCLDFYKYISLDLNLKNEEQLKTGDFTGARHSYTLYKEVCSLNNRECPDGLDRYGFCCNITDLEKNRRIKTRYADYPW